jgi:predicted dehydrogenase
MPARPGEMRLGVVGAGRLAEHVWFGVLNGMPGVSIAGVADPQEERRALAARRCPGAVTAPDLGTLLSSVTLDAVLICSPPADHAASAMQALAANLHVYLEKPLAARVEEARELARRASGYSRVAMVGLNFRHHPAVLRLHAAISSGRIGTPLAMQSVFSVADEGRDTWRAPASGGGALMDLGSHHVDLARFLLRSDIVQVSARTWSRRHDGDTAALELTCASGAHASVLLASGAADDDRLLVLGDEGTASCDRLRGTLTLTARRFLYGRRHAIVREAGRAATALAAAASAAGEPSYCAAFAEFVAAVRSGRPASPSFADGLRSAEAVDAAARSAASGAPAAVTALDGAVA